MDNHIYQLFTEYGGWSWLILGGVLLVLEILMPGIFMLWFGLAALVTGAITLLIEPGFQLQLIIFALSSLISVLIGRKLFIGRDDESDQPLLNKRGDQLIGKTFKVTSAIVNGYGKVKIGDSVWSVTGPDRQEGALVRVTAVEGNRLTVEAVDESTQ